MSKFLPRIRGNAIPKGKGWTWELFLTIGPDGAADPICLSYKGVPFLNIESARNALRLAAAEVMKHVTCVMGLGEPSDLIDLAAGEIKSIAEFVKPTSYPQEGA